MLLKELELYKTTNRASPWICKPDRRETNPSGCSGTGLPITSPAPTVNFVRQSYNEQIVYFPF